MAEDYPWPPFIPQPPPLVSPSATVESWLAQETEQCCMFVGCLSSTLDPPCHVDISRPDGFSKHKTIPEPLLNIFNGPKRTGTMAHSNRKSIVQCARYIWRHEELRLEFLVVFQMMNVFIEVVHDVLFKLVKGHPSGQPAISWIGHAADCLWSYTQRKIIWPWIT